MKGIALALIIITAFLTVGCESDYECKYYLENQAADSITYNLYWRDGELNLIYGSVQPEEREYLVNDIGLGNAANDFSFRAESLFINGNILIDLTDTTLYRTDREDDDYGEFTVIITQDMVE